MQDPTVTPTIRQEMRSRSYVGSFDQDNRRQQTIKNALSKQRFAFSHFLTVTFPTPVVEAQALESMDNGLRTIGRLNKRRVRFFYTLSLERPYWYTASTQAADSLGGGIVDDTQLVTKWHLHALLGGLDAGLTIRQIEKAFRQQCHGFVKAKLYDHDSRLCEYISDVGSGNCIGRLQRTNDRTITNALARLGEQI